jgi:hypothetical protein
MAFQKIQYIGKTLWRNRVQSRAINPFSQIRSFARKGSKNINAID